MINYISDYFSKTNQLVVQLLIPDIMFHPGGIIVEDVAKLFVDKD